MEPTSAPARPLWDRIQTVCASRGWNAVRLERETGVARQTVAKWKTQPRPPQAATVNTVAAALGIPLEEALRLAGVLPSEDQPEPEPEPAEPKPERPVTLEDIAAAIADVQQEIARVTREMEEIRRERAEERQQRDAS